MDEDGKKEGLFKRLKNIEGKNEEQLQLLSKTNKITRIVKNESDHNYNKNFAFYKFYRDFEYFRKRLRGSKYSNMSMFYNLLNEYKKHNVTTQEKKVLKKRL